MVMMTRKRKDETTCCWEKNETTEKTTRSCHLAICDELSI